MPVKLSALANGKTKVSTPNGVKAYGTTKEKALHLRNLLNAVEHSDWRPTGKPAKRAAKAAKPD